MQEPSDSPAKIDPEKWVETHGDILYRYAIYRVREAQVAEDLVQETFIGALGAASRFKGQSSERTWLIGILKHKIMDHFRTNKREIAESEIAPGGENILENLFNQNGQWKKGPGDWDDLPEEVVKNKEFMGILRECLDKLSPNARQVFIWRELEYLTGPEICKGMDISSTNFWVLMHRARGALRRCLEINWFGGNKGSQK